VTQSGLQRVGTLEACRPGTRRSARIRKSEELDAGTRASRFAAVLPVDGDSPSGFFVANGVPAGTFTFPAIAALHHSPSIAGNVNVPAGTPFATKEPRRDYRHHGEYRSKPRRTSTVRNSSDLRILADSVAFQDGSSTYHALQSIFESPLHRSLYFQAAYTYSKSIDNGSGSVFCDEL